jgi:hypothetical protein
LKAGNTGFWTLIKRILAALLSNQQEEVTTTKKPPSRTEVFNCGRLSRTTVGFQGAKLCGSLVTAFLGRHGEKKSSLIAILWYSIASNVQICEQYCGAGVLPAHRFP